jgi:hypothetical protein
MGFNVLSDTQLESFQLDASAQYDFDICTDIDNDERLLIQAMNESTIGVCGNKFNGEIASPQNSVCAANGLDIYKWMADTCDGLRS